MTPCPHCGAVVAVGSWPFCPHGRYGGTVVDDSFPGGGDFVQEHFGNTPETFSSKKAMEQRAKELGLINVVKWAGPTDRHLTRWASMDPQTLQNAEALVARVAERGTATAEPAVTLETYRRL